MIYKKLQNLVDTALYDDVITAEEEARLMARAREMGQDIDEFKSYLEGRKNSRAEWVAECKKRRQEHENRPTYVKLGEEITRLENVYSDESAKRVEYIKEKLDKVVIPTDQEGLFQLANFLFSKYSYGKNRYIYKRKLSECVNTGLLSFPSDERFKNLETVFKEKQKNESVLLKIREKVGEDKFPVLIVFICFFLLFGILCILSAIGILD